MGRLDLRHGLVQRAEQQMLLAPRMLQSIEVLQLSTAELQEYVQRASEENEALAVDDSRETWRAPPRPAHGRGDDFLESQPCRAKSLVERVEEELAIADVAPELDPWVRLLATCLDPSGYLSIGDDALLDLARERDLAGDAATLAAAIAALQRLEPRGIGARNPIEALRLQLDPGHADHALLVALLDDFLEDIAKNKRPAIARALRIDVAHLNTLIEALAGLSLRPAATLVDDAAPTIHPDVVVERAADGADGFDVRVEEAGLPAVSIDARVVALARDARQPRDVKAYLRKKLQSARWLVDAVEDRRRTLLRVSVTLFQHQRAYLEHGPGHLVPVSMTAVAEELQLATSTVSRAVAGKYVQTPWAIQPLRHFFQSAAGATSHAALDDVRAVVRELFAAEDAGQPISDDEVVSALALRGFAIARRTVAKYRSELGIESSYRRRKFA